MNDFYGFQRGKGRCELPNLGESFTTFELYWGTKVSNTVDATLQHQSHKCDGGLMGNWVEPRVKRARPS